MDSENAQVAAAPKQAHTELGDDVLYVMPNNGESRPAKVVKVWRPDYLKRSDYVNLQVFTDGGNDGEPNNMRWCVSVEYDPVEKKKGTFHHFDDVVPT